MTADCVFCAIVEQRAPARVLDADERTLSFLDIAPATRGHALVVPRAHCADVLDVDEQDWAAVGAAAKRVAAAARAGLGAAGVNLLQCTGAAAFQTVFHLHVHVIPRYSGDGLVPPWVKRRGDAALMDEAATDLRAALGCRQRFRGETPPGRPTGPAGR